MSDDDWLLRRNTAFVSAVDEPDPLANIYLHRDRIEEVLGACMGQLTGDASHDAHAMVATLARRLRATIQIGLELAYAQDAPRAPLLQCASYWQRRLDEVLPTFDWAALWPPFSDDDLAAQSGERVHLLGIFDPGGSPAGETALRLPIDTGLLRRRLGRAARSGLGGGSSLNRFPPFGPPRPVCKL